MLASFLFSRLLDFPGPGVSADGVEGFEWFTSFIVQDCPLQLLRWNATSLMNSMFWGWGRRVIGHGTLISVETLISINFFILPSSSPNLEAMSIPSKFPWSLPKAVPSQYLTCLDPGTFKLLPCNSPLASAVIQLGCLSEFPHLVWNSLRCHCTFLFINYSCLILHFYMGFIADFRYLFPPFK